MVTRRSRVEHRSIERRLTKAREERFVKSLEDARVTLDEVIEKAEDGDIDVFDMLQNFSEQMERVYTQAQRMEARDEH